MHGYIGCSTTMLTVGGYHTNAVGGRDFWPKFTGYKGGHIQAWAQSHDEDVWWDQFDAALAADNPTQVWWQLCAHNLPEELDTLYMDAVTVRERLSLRTKVPVFISPLPAYSPENMNNHLIAIPEVTDLCRQLIAEGHGQPGPVFPALTPSTTRPDNIHPDIPTQKTLGRVLKRFFG